MNILYLRGHLWSKWGIKEKELLAPPTSHTVSPQNVPVGMNEKSQKCVHARHGLRACWNRVRIAAEAGWGTRKLLPRTCFIYTPNCLKKPRVNPRLTIPLFSLFYCFPPALLEIFFFVLVDTFSPFWSYYCPSGKRRCVLRMTLALSWCLKAFFLYLLVVMFCSQRFDRVFR